MRPQTFTALVGLLASSCLSQQDAFSTHDERLEIEAKVRACKFEMRNARWNKIEAIKQWEFGFETNAVDMADAKKQHCIDRLSEALSLKRSDVMIAYSAPQGVTN
jgi:hypothetical protein